MPIEPSITPESPVTPTYWVDMIDVAVELPRGAIGPKGEPGNGWTSGSGAPQNPPTVPEGSFYIDLDTGNIWVVEDGIWEQTPGSMMGPTGPAYEHAHDQYLPLAAGSESPLTGKLYGNEGATFDDPIQAGTPIRGAENPKDVVTVEYLQQTNAAVRLERFFGEYLTGLREAIDTGHDWDNATEQGIYQQVGGAGTPPAGDHAPPGTVGRSIGLVQKISQTVSTQLVYDVDRKLLFVRDLSMGAWTNWHPVNHITANVPPPVPGTRDYARITKQYGSNWANGQVWIELENTAGEPN